MYDVQVQYLRINTWFKQFSVIDYVITMHECDFDSCSVEIVILSHTAEMCGSDAPDVGFLTLEGARLHDYMWYGFPTCVVLFSNGCGH